jgi:CheY-like chemotaxis protein
MVQVVENGLLAFEAVRNGYQAGDTTEPFDVVLMDGHMPVLDGEGACRRIRTELPRAKRGVRIIAVTADVMADSAARFLEAGMDAYLPKPISQAVLLKTIREVMEEK